MKKHQFESYFVINGKEIVIEALILKPHVTDKQAKIIHKHMMGKEINEFFTQLCCGDREKMSQVC